MQTEEQIKELAACQRPAYSPMFATMDAQVSKIVDKQNPFGIYIGGENLANFYQKNAIIAALQPFSKYFNASMIWDP